MLALMMSSVCGSRRLQEPTLELKELKLTWQPTTSASQAS
jgi:hypothetical protein